MNSSTETMLIKNSFYITYAFLMTTATITFIEAIRTKDLKVRNILNLETCISVVATFFYSAFMKKMEESKQIDYAEINLMRYVDWSITTPIMLLVLLLALLYNNKSGSLSFFSFLGIVGLNYGMLGSGYLGEIGVLEKTIANVFGFGFFAAMFYWIYIGYVRPKGNADNWMLYMIFLVLWTLYGVVYYMDQVTQNVAYNVLDLLSKCFVGIFFWAYFTKVFTLNPL